MIVDLGLTFKVLDLGLGGLQSGYVTEMHREKGFMFKSQLWTGWALEYNVGRMHNPAQARDVMTLLEEWAKSAATKSYTKCPVLSEESHDLTVAYLVWKGEITKTNKVRVEYATVPCLSDRCVSLTVCQGIVAGSDTRPLDRCRCRCPAIVSRRCVGGRRDCR